MLAYRFTNWKNGFIFSGDARLGKRLRQQGRLPIGNRFQWITVSLIGLVTLTCGCERSSQKNDSETIVTKQDRTGLENRDRPASTAKSEESEESKDTEDSERIELLARPRSGQPWFEDGTIAAGIDFKNFSGRSDERFLPEIMGSGVLVADFDRNGAPDILFVNGGKPRSQTRPERANNRLFLNDGQGNFRDATLDWNLPSLGYGMGGAVGDFDNDGWPDVYLTTFGGSDVLLRNTGKGFVDVTAESGINPDAKWSSSALFFDADNDGWLELLVIRYVEYNEATAVPTYFNGVHVYSTPQFHDGVPDRLYRNNRDGTFTEITDFHPLPEGDPEKKENAFKGLAVGTADLTGDGLPDIYVANDIRRNFLLVNKGNFEFEESGSMLGVAYGDTGSAQAGMGVAFAHLNDEGIPAISCANFQGESANLFVPRGKLFMERADVLGVARATRPRLQWGMLFFDANNDGQEEFMIVNGHIYDNIELMYTNIGFAQQNSLMKMENGRFIDISDTSGPALKAVQVSRGLAMSDFNGNGLVDFVVSNNDEIAQLGINLTPEPGQFVSLWLEGTDSNRSAIGTKLIAKVGDRRLTREIFGGMSYLSASDLRVHFGLADATQIDELQIHWPSGVVQTLTDIQAGHHYHLIEGETLVSYIPGKQIIEPGSRN